MGIEWGFGNDKRLDTNEHERAMKEYHSGQMVADIDGGAGKCDSKFSLADNVDYPFGINTAKLFSAIKGHDVCDYVSVVKEYGEKDVFKANLYPVALPNHNYSEWDKYNLADYTGLVNKKEYRKFCATHRFPFFRAELIKHKPKLLLCMGTSYINQFHRCFSTDTSRNKLNNERFYDSAETNKRVRNFYWKWLNHGTLFVVTPFPLNASGLNSDDLLKQFGDRIKDLLKQGFIEKE